MLKLYYRNDFLSCRYSKHVLICNNELIPKLDLIKVLYNEEDFNIHIRMNIYCIITTNCSDELFFLNLSLKHFQRILHVGKNIFRRMLI